MIRQGLQRAASQLGGHPLIDEGLLDEVNYLVERPIVISGEFDKRYLELPRDVLIASMCEHQRYFPVLNDEGELLPSFLIVSNGSVSAKETIRIGNERVLRARLEDASFFISQDLKRGIEDFVKDGKGRVYQLHLGTIYDKTLRIMKLAQLLAERLAPEKVQKVKRAAWLAKADLSTLIVGEFPALQGVMGYHYALKGGEEEEIATAIREHYLPRFAGDPIPETITGSIVGIADRLDSIVGCLGIGVMPTGSEDPYGLRRQAQGMINIIIDKEFSISLTDLINESISLLNLEAKGGLASKVKDFFCQRLQAHLINQGIRDDVAMAVMKVESDNPLDAYRRAKALMESRKEEDFPSLEVAFKRVMNILSNEDIREYEIREELLLEKEEIELYKVYSQIKERVIEATSSGDYKKALNILKELREPVDSFFDGVMVMVEDKAVRENRLSILGSISGLFHRIGDFSYLRPLA
jgi:glycyl-tRNA synthetase beta chain